MDNQDERNELKRRFPPNEFWKALHVVRNFAFSRGELEYCSERGVPREGSFRNSIDIVDDYLDIAIDRGWLDEDVK